MPHRLSLFWYYRSMIIEGLRWLQLATRSPAATPFDRWIAHLSMAGQLDDPALRMFATTTELMDATAAVSHAAMGVGVGLAARRPDDAVAWAGRMLDHHRQLGLGDTPMLMELKADALSLAGQAYEATV